MTILRDSFTLCLFAKVDHEVFECDCDGLQHEERYLIQIVLAGGGRNIHGSRMVKLMLWR
jgi:hypothetical protein